MSGHGALARHILSPSPRVPARPLPTVMPADPVQADALRDLCRSVLKHRGIPGEDADYVADTLVEADLRGIHSHGSMRLRGMPASWTRA